MKRLTFLVFMLCLSVFARQRESFDFDWKFSRGDFPGAEKKNFDDSDWQFVNIPHDWSIEGEYDKAAPSGPRCGYLPTGIGWYRKELEIPSRWEGKDVRIDFDGVFRKSTVYVDGKKLGHRPYGWISFSYNITPHIQGKEKVLIAVRVDNTKQPAARWYTGSGIYAHTWLTATEKVKVAQWGVQIISELEGDSARVDAGIKIRNTANSAEKIRCKAQIKAPSGKSVAESESEPFLVPANGEFKYSPAFDVKSPRLWSPESPSIYTIKIELLSGEEVLDTYTENFGIRTTRWDGEKGFFLNGKNMKIRGMCMHIDAGPLGAAVPDKILEQRLRMVKDMGCNSVRTSHYPRPPVFYDICDRIGLMVMDEIFDGWKQKAAQDYGALDFDRWWKTDLTDWLRRDRNHPSIIIWSLGNETHGNEIAEKMVRICHQLDPTRKVTSGSSSSKMMEVFGENGRTEAVSYKNPSDKPFIGTECVHTWHVRGSYRTQTWYRDGFKKGRTLEIPDLTEKEIFHYDWTDSHSYKRCFNSSYDNSTVRDNVRHFELKTQKSDWLSGSYRWTAFDYIGEAGYISGGWPFKLFNSGVIDMANFPKDAYYLYQSLWTDGSEDPMVHILPHWTHPTMPKGTEIPVHVYSNCDEVKLYCNGKNLGSQKLDISRWDKMNGEWLVPWEPGKIKAEGYINGQLVCSETVQTASAPARIELETDNSSLEAGRKDYAQAAVSITDENGNFYPYGENRIYFKLFGAGKIKATGSGSPIDTETHNKPDRKAFMGLAKAYVRSGKESGDALLLAASILGEKRQITSNKAAIDVAQITLSGAPERLDTKVKYAVGENAGISDAKQYYAPFSVPEECVVKAWIYADGELVLECEESFGDEGLVWQQAKLEENGVYYEAESSDFDGAKFSKAGRGYTGTGYLDFDGSEGSIEWSVTTDGGGEAVWLVFHYAGNDPESQRDMELIFNSQSPEKLSFKSTSNWQKDWQTIKVKRKLNLGSNIIKLKTDGQSGMNIDKLEVRTIR
ncbi:Beta-galactosidase [Sedimentisphaera cyanobacteriorum]|uniref:Beta-galactosidase n=1 Tax=Sedimentisphaera cyanobacteriorum TaxID=1940790 RepID=A0A1Q2HSP8_9BACT|nr:glycoside hydrolase family 2 [Sedimentisphaera cyanobacteriorum]AQQ10286.1 Beta-galactosidase [Sedimentisphaera cyanobacteriorum]